MADSEERPSKIRKIDRSESSLDNSTKAQMSPEPPDKSEPDSTENPGTGEGDHQNGSNAGEKLVLSKSQQKKLLKTQRWEAGKEYRRIKRREKHKEKQAKKAEQRAEEKKEEISKAEDIETQKKLRGKRPVQAPVALILDCDFDQYMSEKEIISLGAQVTRCYSVNKNTPYRSHLAVSSFGGRMKTRFETVLTRNHESWKGVTFHDDDFMAAAEKLNVVMQGPSGGKLVGALAARAVNSSSNGGSNEQSPQSIDETKPNGDTAMPDQSATVVEPVASMETAETAPNREPSRKRSRPDAEETAPEEAATPAKAEQKTPKVETPAVQLKPPTIVYLTSDSPDTLTDLEPNTSYIIGGIVDKNRHKGICYKRACERGIRTAKLPIGEYMTMQSRSVLAINHVVEIMLKWLETGDWGEAFLSVIPKRKEAKLKVTKGEEEEGGGESENEDDGGNRPDRDDEDDEGGPMLEVGNQPANGLDAEKALPSPPYEGPIENLESNVGLENAASSNGVEATTMVEQQG